MADHERHIKDIEFITQQLEKAKTFGEIYGDFSPTYHRWLGETLDVQRLLESLGLTSSKILRGESYAEPEVITAVEEEIKRLRNFIVTHSGIDPKQRFDFYVSQEENELAANNEERDTVSGRLHLNLQEELESNLIGVRLGFSFHNTFKLDMELYDPNNVQKREVAVYHSGLQQLNTMSELEGRLLPYYLSKASDTFGI